MEIEMYGINLYYEYFIRPAIFTISSSATANRILHRFSRSAPSFVLELFEQPKQNL